jgi:hypothetical protein
MAIYELQNATLGELEGQGFAYTRKVSSGKSYQGVFFSDDRGELEPLQESEEPLTFSGTIYDGKREKQEELPVTIINVVSTPSGDRAEFEKVEEEDE